MNEILISIIIPVYQVENYLCEAVDSAIVACEQFNIEKSEIILVDDGSTDNSGKICDKYKENQSIIKVIHQKNGGLSVARNTGLSLAKGKYVYFLDSDDYIVPNTIKDTVSIAEQENADFVFFDAFIFYTDCEPQVKPYLYTRHKKYKSGNGQKVLSHLLFMDEFRTAVPLMILRKDYLINNDLRFQDGLLHEDELFTGLVYLFDGKVAHCHYQLYARRIRPSSIMTATTSQLHYESILQIFNLYVLMLEKGTIAGKSAKQYTARLALNVYSRYNSLPNQSKIKIQSEFNTFEKLVENKKYFGDIRLKGIFLSGIKGNIYRFEWKLFKTVRRGLKKI